MYPTPRSLLRAVLVTCTAATALVAAAPPPVVAVGAVPPDAPPVRPVIAAAPQSVAAPRSAAQSASAPQPAAVRRGASALRIAMGRLGRPYRYGAAGPSAFDCSGLVHWSYRQVGVTLPRSSSAMSRVGTPVSRGALQPGDLVFFYRPVSHVGIYVGNGQILHASTAGQPVKISPISRMPFNSARRI